MPLFREVNTRQTSVCGSAAVLSRMCHGDRQFGSIPALGLDIEVRL